MLAALVFLTGVGDPGSWDKIVKMTVLNMCNAILSTEVKGSMRIEMLNRNGFERAEPFAYEKMSVTKYWLTNSGWISDPFSRNRTPLTIPTPSNQ